MRTVILLFAICISACAATNGETFKQNLLNCVKANSEDTAVISDALTCMNDALTTSYVGCLTNIQPEVAWTTEEVVCIANAYKSANGVK